MYTLATHLDGYIKLATKRLRSMSIARKADNLGRVSDFYTQSSDNSGQYSRAT